MSDVSQGEGWWQASDGKWYPPDLRPDLPPPPKQPKSSLPQPGSPPAPSTSPSVGKRVGVAVGVVVLVIVAAIVAFMATGKVGQKHLPMTVANDSDNSVVLGSCLASSDGTQVTATGSFSSPVQGTATIGGAVAAPITITVSHEMNLTVTTSAGTQIASNSVDVPVGSTTWSVSASNQQPGTSPTGCLVELTAAQTGTVAPPTTTTAPIPNRAILPPATTAPVVNECSEPLTYAEDGSFTPLTCANGTQINTLAWDAAAKSNASVLGLGGDALPGSVGVAACNDVQHSTIPIETAAIHLAELYYGWQLNFDPSIALATGGC